MFWYTIGVLIFLSACYCFYESLNISNIFVALLSGVVIFMGLDLMFREYDNMVEQLMNFISV